MDKNVALQKLGGSVASAARAVGVSYHAVWKWPDVLTSKISDRVLAAEARLRADVSGKSKGS
jgi:molybdenum-dependent DNA-binding transcriptional regulator ModE